MIAGSHTCSSCFFIKHPHKSEVKVEGKVKMVIGMMMTIWMMFTYAFPIVRVAAHSVAFWPTAVPIAPPPHQASHTVVPCASSSLASIARTWKHGCWAAENGQTRIGWTPNRNQSWETRTATIITLTLTTKHDESTLSQRKSLILPFTNDLGTWIVMWLITMRRWTAQWHLSNNGMALLKCWNSASEGGRMQPKEGRLTSLCVNHRHAYEYCIYIFIYGGVCP